MSLEGNVGFEGQSASVCTSSRYEPYAKRATPPCKPKCTASTDDMHSLKAASLYDKLPHKDPTTHSVVLQPRHGVVNRGLQGGVSVR